MPKKPSVRFFFVHTEDENVVWWEVTWIKKDQKFLVKTFHNGKRVFSRYCNGSTLGYNLERVLTKQIKP